MFKPPTGWRLAFQALRKDFQQGAEAYPAVRHAIVQALDEEGSLPPSIEREMRDAGGWSVGEIRARWDIPAANEPDAEYAQGPFLDWMRRNSPPKLSYLSGDSAGRSKFEYLAERAWLALPGSPEGKVQAYPQPRAVEGWLAFVYQQLRWPPSSYLAVEDELWAAHYAQDGRLVEQRFAPRTVKQEGIVSTDYPDAKPLSDRASHWMYTALATDPFTASVAAIDMLLAHPDPEGPYLISWQELNAYQESATFQNSNFLVDEIILGEGLRFPIYRYWCVPVDGNKPSLCPNADPPRDEKDRQALLQYLPDIATRFRQLHLIKEGQTIHWVGRQVTLSTLCRCLERAALITEEQKALAAMVARDRAEMADEKERRRQAQEQAKPIARIRQALGRMRSYGGPVGPDATADADWVERLADLYEALAEAELLHLLDRLPDRGEARRFVLSLLRWAGTGQRQLALETLANVAPLGKLDEALAAELTRHLPDDLLHLLPDQQLMTENSNMPEVFLNEAHHVAMLAYDFGRRWQQDHQLPRRDFQLLVQALEGVPVVDTKDPRYVPVLQKLREVKRLTEQLAHPAWDTNLGPEFCSAGLALHEVIKTIPPGKTEWLNWMEQSGDTPAAGQSSPSDATAKESEQSPGAHAAPELHKVHFKVPLEVFFAYSHKDEKLRDQLERHLSQLKNEGLITGWHYRKIGAGNEWEGQVDQHLKSAPIILLLVSADFLASRYCYDVEMKRALERHETGEARVIPIILRPCDWQSAPFGKLTALPTHGVPVTARGWKNRDEAFADVAKGIRAEVDSLTANPRAFHL